MIRELQTDVVIFGGGIAGLWMLGRLRQAGYSALLLEQRALGGLQTVASQGIIHGGTKYALSGRLTGSAQAIASMPGVWRACLEGRGELDLSRVRLLSRHQYLFSTGGLASEMVGFFASHAMRSRIAPVNGDDRPPVLRDTLIGRVYRLAEPVLDLASLIAELVRQYGDYCLQADFPQGLRLREGRPPQVELNDPRAGLLRVRARRLVLAAGAGNERLLSALGWIKPHMQRRPLHMLMLKGDMPDLYAHCLGAGSNPRMTITTHPGPDGERVWYLGGQVAESGVGRSNFEQVEAGRRELAQLMPWIDTRGLRWAGFRIDRAELRQPGGRRPDKPFLETRDGISVVWPTKLAFAPALAEDLLKSLNRAGVAPGADMAHGPDWPRPPLAPFPWENVGAWI